MFSALSSQLIFPFCVDEEEELAALSRRVSKQHPDGRLSTSAFSVSHFPKVQTVF